MKSFTAALLGTTAAISLMTNAAHAQEAEAPQEEAVEEEQGIVVVGSRGKPRTDVDRPVPVDVVNSEDLASTGQTDLGQQVQFSSPVLTVPPIMLIQPRYAVSAPIRSWC
jgi:hypothetical protein